MSDQIGSASPIQFDRAEFTAPVASLTCAACAQPIVQSYYEAGGKTICSTCRELRSGAMETRSTARLLRALAVGLAAAIAGSIVWWGVRRLTGYEIGLISIGIGIGVGRAVRWGGRNRGGLAYQLLAVALTYLSITGNYVPDVINELVKSDETAQTAGAPTTAATATAPVPPTKPIAVKANAASESVGIGAILLAIGAIILVAATVPFSNGASNFIGILIIGFGLWEAWKINRRVDEVINGPFSVTPAGPNG
jgi:hypothetical protein